jgi:hypothetical protein
MGNMGKIEIPKLVAPPGYRSQAEDTTIDTDLLQFHLLRQQSPPQRLLMAASLMRSARQFSINCFRRRFSHLTPQQFARKLAEAWLQEYCPPHYVPTGSEMTWIQDSIQLAAQLHRIFEPQDIPYYVTGGVAAIAYGESRTTQDLDVVLAIVPQDIPQLVAALESSGFYVPGIEDVISGRMQTLQITQMETISRADLVIARMDEFDLIKFERRQSYPLPDGTEIYLASPEDLILNKLRWGQRSQSEKQWRDVLGVLKTQQEALDFGYLEQWATQLDLLELTHQAIREAGVEAIANTQKNSRI